MKFGSLLPSCYRSGPDRTRTHSLAPACGRNLRVRGLLGGGRPPRPATLFNSLSRGGGSPPWLTGAGVPALRDGVNVPPAPWFFRGGHGV